MTLHFNKGLGGGSPAAIEAARDTAMNPEVLDAFALAIIASDGGPAFGDLPFSNWQWPASAATAFKAP